MKTNIDFDFELNYRGQILHKQAFSFIQDHLN